MEDGIGINDRHIYSECSKLCKTRFTYAVAICGIISMILGVAEYISLTGLEESIDL